MTNRASQHQTHILGLDGSNCEMIQENHYPKFNKKMSLKTTASDKNSSQECSKMAHTYISNIQTLSNIVAGLAKR